MNIEMRGIWLRLALGVGLLAATAIGGGGWTNPAGAAAKDDAIIADWPEASRRIALAMIERHGPPDRRDEDALTWLGLYRARRTVVHRSSAGEGAVEQVVLYRVPNDKIGELKAFDSRLTVDRGDSELSIRTDSVRANFLVLNLAHEIASGFRSASAARAVREKEMRLAVTGKSSRYRESLLFEGELPFARPGRAPVLPGEERAIPPPVQPEAL